VWGAEKSFSDAPFQRYVKSLSWDKQWTDARTKSSFKKSMMMSETSMRAIRQMQRRPCGEQGAVQCVQSGAGDCAQRQHEQFLASMQRGTDMSMRWANGERK